MPLRLELNDHAATLHLGQSLASVFSRRSRPPALLLTGGLGAGKTTLIRALVESLPGAAQAEVTSPSFNIVNLYPTTPPVAHFDLYRLTQGCLDDDIFELLDSEENWCVVEWAERLHPEDVPVGAVRIEMEASQTGRTARIQAMVSSDEEAIRVLLQDYEG